MDFSATVTANGFEVRLVVDFQRLRAFVRNLLITIWAIVSLLLALKAAGIDVMTFFGF